jgi:WD40 repeat protein
LAKTTAEATAAKQAATDAEKPFRALAYSADGAQLASAGDNGLVRVWASDNGTPIDTFDAHKTTSTAVALTPDGAIVSGGADNAAILWNPTPDWALERTIGNVSDASTFVDRVISLAFSHDGRLLATGGGEPSRSGQLKIFNVADGSLAREIPEAHSDTIFGLEFSPDDALVASSAADRFVKVFSIAGGSPVRSFEGHTHHVLGVSWQWDGKVLASCGADNVIKVWDFVTGDQRRTTPAFGKEITSVNFVAAQPKVLATSGDKTVRLVNVDNGNSERSFSGPTDFMYSAAVSADGKLVAAGGQESTLFIWLVDNGQLVRSLPAPKPPEPKPPAQTAAQ